MTDNEKLIVEAAQWKGDNAYPMIQALVDALESAEKAHTPTDDEREALETAVWTVLEPRLEDVIDLDLNVPSENVIFAILVGQVVEAVAGFHRTGVPEPRAIINDGTDDAWQAIADALGNLGYDLNSHEDTAAWVQQYLFTPQGEPSDAQVQAALRSWYGSEFVWSEKAIDDMRVALRAAGEAGQ